MVLNHRSFDARVSIRRGFSGLDTPPRASSLFSIWLTACLFTTIAPETGMSWEFTPWSKRLHFYGSQRFNSIFWNSRSGYLRQRTLFETKTRIRSSLSFLALVVVYHFNQSFPRPPITHLNVHRTVDVLLKLFIDFILFRLANG